MESLKKHGDPLENELREEPARNIDEVKSNQPGSKGRRLAFMRRSFSVPRRDGEPLSSG